MIQPQVRKLAANPCEWATAAMPLLGQLKRAARHGEIPRGEDQGPSSEQTGAECQQPASGVIYRRLVQRSLDGADVMAGEPIRQRDEQHLHDRQRQDDDGDPCQPSDASRPRRPAL